jgi:hypothetical protein
VPLQLAVVGMEGRQRQLLEMVVARHRPDSVRLAPEAEAAACLVDLDSVGATDRLRQIRLAGERPLLLVSVTAPDATTLAGDLFVAKPISTPALIEALDELARRCAPQAVPVPVPTPPVLVVVPPAAVELPEPIGAPDPVAAEAPSSTAPAYYDPGRYLQSVAIAAAREAAARGQTALIRGPWPSLTLLPAQGLALIAGSEELLQQFAAQADMAQRAKVSYLPAPDSTAALADAVPLDSLIWKLALWAARGRLPAGTDPDRPVRLRRQPDLSRLGTASGGSRLALHWSGQAASPRALPELLDLPPEQVNSFFSAARALDLIDDRPEPAIAVATAAAANSDRGDDPPYVPGSFARRFLARLRGG